MKIQKSIIQSHFAFYTRHRTVYEDVIERIFKAMFQFFPSKSRSYIHQWSFSSHKFTNVWAGDYITHTISHLDEDTIPKSCCIKGIK